MGAKQRRWTRQVDEFMLGLVADHVGWEQIADLIYLQFELSFKPRDVQQRCQWLMGTNTSSTRKYRPYDD